jgi:hypothetical protein
MARDAYSLLHFPMLCGLIIYGYAIHQCMAHPDEVLAITGPAGLIHWNITFLHRTYIGDVEVWWKILFSQPCDHFVDGWNII